MSGATVDFRRCRYCAAPFVPKKVPHQVYCCSSCYRRAWTEREKARRRARAPAHCGFCGQRILGRQSNAKYCSRACCEQAHNLRRRRRKPLPERPCAVCGGSFTPTRSNQRYCSKQCCQQAWLEAEKIRRHARSLKTCLHCGQPIIGRKAGAKFCSARCCAAAHNRRQRQQKRPLRERICPTCGQRFLPNQPHRKYCSPACQQRAKLERERKGPLPDKHKATCPVCDVEFVTKRWNQLYCSKQCRWYALNHRRINKMRRTNEEPRVSPQLIRRRAAAIRQKWDQGTRLRRGKRLPEMPLFKPPPPISQAERVREHLRSGNHYGALLVASGWKRPGWLAELVGKAWVAWQQGRRDGPEVAEGLEALRRHLGVGG